MKTLARWLRAAARWLDPGPGQSPARARAAELVVWAEQWGPQASGEAKRHQVYAKLLKEFPQERRRDLGLAIELAMQDQP